MRINKPKTAKNYKGEQQEIKWPKGKAIENLDSVFLIRKGSNKYYVVYGLEVSEEMNEDEAAREFGHCVMHQVVNG